jgi:hypothetical protein
MTENNDTPMSEWFRRLFPQAQDANELVSLYALHTLLGDWEVHTPIKTFQIRHFPTKNDFYLSWDDEKGSNRVFSTVFDAIKAVANHQTGVEAWDRSTFKASDYLRDWKRHISKWVIFNFLDSWIKCNPNGSLREMVDYFEHENTLLLADRMEIRGFLEEMIGTGQIERLPGDWMKPAELESVVQLAKEYGIPIGPPESE